MLGNVVSQPDQEVFWIRVIRGILFQQAASSCNPGGLAAGIPFIRMLAAMAGYELHKENSFVRQVFLVESPEPDILSRHLDLA